MSNGNLREFREKFSDDYVWGKWHKGPGGFYYNSKLDSYISQFCLENLSKSIDLKGPPVKMDLCKCDRPYAHFLITHKKCEDFNDQHFHIKIFVSTVGGNTQLFLEILKSLKTINIPKRYSCEIENYLRKHFPQLRDLRKVKDF